jgi:excisionase family DNA binding protein
MQAVTITQITPEELELLIENSIRKILSAQQPPKESEGDELLTAKEAATFLSLTVPTLYGKVHNREIPNSKQGKRLYFSKLQLIAWVQSGRRQTSSELDAKVDQYLATKGR